MLVDFRELGCLIVFIRILCVDIGVEVVFGEFM